MMQSRLTTIAAKSNRALSPARFQGLRRGLVPISTGSTADPLVHAVDDHEPAVPSGKYSREDFAKAGPGTENGPFAAPKPQYGSSLRLESTVVGQPSKPISQQKRAHSSPSVIDDVSCVGEVGEPWPADEEDRGTDREEQREDDRDYYKHHKASPLSEVEFADTRKPITRATDGTADSGYYGGEREVVGWLPEQLDTAEEALRRATEIWKQNAMRGDPDAPHSRVLRKLRGEWF